MHRAFGILALILVVVSHARETLSSPVVIAHRGASGYLPEHTLAAAAYAHALGADFIEQDLVMSKDDVLVVCHDIHIDMTTDVAAIFPDRKRSDGRYYAIDFTWDELRTLRVKERFDPATGAPIFAQRFPHHEVGFRLCRLEEAILLVHGLNRSTGRRVGLYPEIKAPAWHRRQGKDPGRALLAILAAHGYADASSNVFVQCFEPAELKRLRFELKTALRLVQLIQTEASEDPDIDYPAMLTPAGLKEISAYAQGIGPHLSHVARAGDETGAVQHTSLVRNAHAAGLVVHPYTFRSDALPRGIATLERLFEVYIREAGVDGLFVDQPDAAVEFLRRRSQ